MRTIGMITVALAAAALLPVGCGGESEPEAQDQASEPQTLGLGGGDQQGEAAGDRADAVEQARRQAEQATEAAGEQDPYADLSDATAEQAIEAYIELCAAGEFERAATFCHPDAPGTESLKNLGERGKQAAEQSGVDVFGFLTEGLDQATYELIEQEDESRYLFEVAVPDKRPVEVAVVLLDGSWRVIPPEGSQGLPMGS